MSNQVRSYQRVLSVAVIVAGAGVAANAHNYVGLEHGRPLVAARVQSPNALLTDFPVPIAGTDLSIVCFKVRNTSEFDSRITAIGLELPGDLTGFTLLSPTDTDFDLIEQVSQVPGLPDVTLDFALVTGRTFGGGRPDSGLAPSASLTTFCISGPFLQNVPIERILDRGALRMQRVGGDGELSDVAVWESRPQ